MHCILPLIYVYEIDDILLKSLALPDLLALSFTQKQPHQTTS